MSASCRRASRQQVLLRAGIRSRIIFTFSIGVEELESLVQLARIHVLTSAAAAAVTNQTDELNFSQGICRVSYANLSIGVLLVLACTLYSTRALQCIGVSLLCAVEH